MSRQKVQMVQAVEMDLVGKEQIISAALAWLAINL